MKRYILIKTGLIVSILLTTVTYAKSYKECPSALKKTEEIYNKAVDTPKLKDKQLLFSDAISRAREGSYHCSYKTISDKKIVDRLLLFIELSYMGNKGKSIPNSQDIDIYQNMRKASRAKKIAKVKASHGNKPLSESEKQKRIQKLKLDSTCGSSFFIMKSSYDVLFHMNAQPSHEIIQLLQETRNNCNKSLDNELILLDIKVGEKLPELAWKKPISNDKHENHMASSALNDNEARNMAEQLCKNVSKSSVGFNCSCNNTNIRNFGKIGGKFDLVTRDVMIGHFEDKQKLEAIVPTEGCEPHMYNWGGYAVYDKSETGSWKLQKYHSGKLKDCKKISFSNSKSKLVCSSHFFAQGYDENRLYIAKLTKDGIKSIDTLYEGTSNEGTGSKKQYNTTISKWLIENENVIFIVNGKRKSISLKKYENK